MRVSIILIWLYLYPFLVQCWRCYRHHRKLWLTCFIFVFFSPSNSQNSWSYGTLKIVLFFPSFFFPLIEMISDWTPPLHVWKWYVMMVFNYNFPVIALTSRVHRGRTDLWKPLTRICWDTCLGSRVPPSFSHSPPSLRSPWTTASPMTMELADFTPCWEGFPVIALTSRVHRGRTDLWKPLTRICWDTCLGSRVPPSFSHSPPSLRSPWTTASPMTMELAEFMVLHALWISQPQRHAILRDVPENVAQKHRVIIPSANDTPLISCIY